MKLNTAYLFKGVLKDTKNVTYKPFNNDCVTLRKLSTNN